jgi:hypothetical protein
VEARALLEIWKVLLEVQVYVVLANTVFNQVSLIRTCSRYNFIPLTAACFALSANSIKHPFICP